MTSSWTDPLSPRPPLWVFWLVRPHKVSNKVSNSYVAFCQNTLTTCLQYTDLETDETHHNSPSLFTTEPFQANRNLTMLFTASNDKKRR